MPQSEPLCDGCAPELEFDAVIVGASLSGLVAGAILANRGFRIAVLDAIDHPGGRVGATRYRDCWINFGHRDALAGIGDVGQPHAVRRLAERAAGISIPVRENAFGGSDGAGGNRVRIHDPHLGTISDVSMADITTSSDASNEVETFAHLIRAFVPEAADVAAAAEEIKNLFERAAAIPEEEAWRMVPERMGEWSARQLRSPVARQFMINLMEAGHASPGEDASVGRWLLCFPWRYSSPHWTVDPEVGGMQSYVQPWVRAIQKRGGELWLGWKPQEIIVERPDQSGQSSGLRARVAGVTAINISNIVQVFRTRIVISDYFGWDLPQLLDPELLPEDFLARAETTRKNQGEALGWIGMFKELPRIQSTGKPESFSGWQRVQAGMGLERRYNGGFFWASLTDPATCPPGKHLLQVVIGHHGASRQFADVRTMADTNLRYLRETYYADFDEHLEWGRYFWRTAPQLLAWHLKPHLRHAVKVSTVQGLYSASSSAEGMGGWLDIEHQVALEAVSHIDRDFGRPGGQGGIDVSLPATNVDWARWPGIDG